MSLSSFVAVGYGVPPPRLLTITFGVRSAAGGLMLAIMAR
jgi:hypothetical protein